MTNEAHPRPVPDGTQQEDSHDSTSGSPEATRHAPELVTSDGIRLVLTVTRREVSVPELVDFGERYWSIEGMDADHGGVVWRFTINELALEWGETLKRCDVLAAAGVCITLQGFECAGCGRAPLLRSRADLHDYLINRPPTRCLQCDKGFAQAIEREFDPFAQERRERRQQRAQYAAKQRLARDRWTAHQRSQIEAAFPLRLEPGGAKDRPTASVRAEAAALLMVAISSGRATVTAAHDTFLPPAPTTGFLRSLLEECLAQDVLRIHPDTPTRAWAWQQSFEQALAQADSPDSVGEPARGDVDLLQVHWYAPFGDGGQIAADELNRALSARLAAKQLDGQRRQEMLELCTELIHLEAIDDFEVRLHEAGLPRLSTAQRQRLSNVWANLAEFLSLAQCSTLASRAIRGRPDGGTGQRLGSHPRYTNYAIAWLGDIINKPLAYDLAGVPPAVDNHYTSMMTSMIFGLSCGINPWRASMAAVAEELFERQDQTEQLTDIDMTEAIHLLLDRELRIDPHAVY
ncbi:hypothetical protein [Actinoplanes sp. NPDC051859]|uniref:hypothetical protein n=1 Tax=Actinoplanes sp. NPDC051859 TaxID=3363909 RepID=UPI0037B60DDF